MPKKQQQSLLSYFSKSTTKQKPLKIDDAPLQNKPTILLIDDNENNLKEKSTACSIRSPIKKKRRIILEDDCTSEEDQSENLEQSAEDSATASSKDSSEDEMSFLKDSDILQKRTRGRKKSRYLESLQQLKDRKTSFDIPDEDLDGPIDKFFGHSQNTKNASDSELNSAEDSDFVVEDDVIDGVRISISSKDRGKEERMDMPAEFSKNRVLSWSKQFGIYIEYLVAICLDIEVESSDEYKLAKNAVVRRVESYKDSILTSDVWLSKFKYCVDLYPNWQMGEKKSDYSESLCQACKANKPAVITINLFSDEDNIGVKFDLGRECYRKAQLYHGFTHFETKIYREVEGHVNRLIKKHSGLKEQVCDAICDELNGSGVIKRLFRETKQDFVKTIRIYNLKGERYILEDTSSSDD